MTFQASTEAKFRSGGALLQFWPSPPQERYISAVSKPPLICLLLSLLSFSWFNGGKKLITMKKGAAAEKGTLVFQGFHQ